MGARLGVSIHLPPFPLARKHELEESDESVTGTRGRAHTSLGGRGIEKTTTAFADGIARVSRTAKKKNTAAEKRSRASLRRWWYTDRGGLVDSPYLSSARAYSPRRPPPRDRPLTIGSAAQRATGTTKHTRTRTPSTTDYAGDAN